MRCTKQLHSSLPGTASASLCAEETQCSPPATQNPCVAQLRDRQLSTSPCAPAPGLPEPWVPSPALHCGSPRERPCEELLPPHPNPGPCWVGTGAAPVPASWPCRCQLGAPLKGCAGSTRDTEGTRTARTHPRFCQGWTPRAAAAPSPAHAAPGPLLRTTAVDRKARVFFNFLEIVERAQAVAEGWR